MIKSRSTTMIRRLIVVALLLPLVQSSIASAAIHTPAHVSDTTHYAGWAMEAYPGDSLATLTAEMQRQIKAGANVIWIGHNNPGEVIKSKPEPGLSYAVWAAFTDAASPEHIDAVAIIQAQQRALDAAKALGVKVVLPIGYQIQMGTAWNTAHPQDIRRSADNTFYGPGKGGESASFYAPDYRHDIVAYYHWIDATFAQPYASTIMMLNLADEPADGDYSTWADQAFRARFHFGLHDAGADRARLAAVGRFESEYIADYAAWGAGQWQSIEPHLPVTLSFDGGYSRSYHEGPNLEAIFAKAPANFVVTFDAYPRDGLYNTPLRESDITALFTLVRTLGHYSAVYHRPLWLWSTANSWGLNGASNDPGNIADAVANGFYLAQLVNQGGGYLQGIAVWNYNIVGQGLFNDTHHLTYDPNLMFSRVSAGFPLWRAIMAAPVGSPDTVLLAPDAPIWRSAAAHLLLRAIDSYQWGVLAAPARNNVDAIALTHLDGDTLPALRTVVVLARAPDDLSLADRGALLSLLGHGGTVVVAATVAQALIGASAATQVLASGGAPAITVRRLASPQGMLLAVDGAPVENLFSDAATAWAGALWQQVLHCSTPTQGYVVSAGGYSLLYSSIVSGAASMTFALAAGSQANTLTIFDMYGKAQQTLSLTGHTGLVHVLLSRRSYALLPLGNIATS